MIAISDLVRVSFRQVVRQRGFGVILSIALGITAFIVLSVLGREIRYKVGQDMVLMGGVNVIQIYMNDRQYPGQPQREFLPETVEALKKLPGVGLVSRNIYEQRGFPIRPQGSERTLDIVFMGVDEFFSDVYSLNLNAGRFFNNDDVARHKRVCMLGNEAALNLFGSEKKAVGELLFLGQDVFEIVGVVSGVMLGDWRRGGFLPYTSMADRHWGSDKVSRLFLRAVGWEDVPPLIDILPKTIIEHQDAPYMVIRTQNEQLSRLRVTFMWVEALLWLGILASLMLGGFGIWYGTFAAVRARTREVGLKKAMGGSDADIMAQFLTEALCKSVAGGILGIVIGFAFVQAGAFKLGIGVDYPLLLASSMGSILFSAFIGVAGGIYPAMQASRMDVVSALRFE
ncbi:MAG: ABC transporter permease [Desulfovibrio sp.]|nr:ABC transporter permease [Desulfovibrio sp.]